METFSALLAFCEGNSPVTGEFPSQSQWRVDSALSLICAWSNGWVNNRDAGDYNGSKLRKALPTEINTSENLHHFEKNITQRCLSGECDVLII